jgi:diguanylate cyclase (GGDEF)-like protein
MGETSSRDQLSFDGNLLATEDASYRDERTGLANERGFDLVFERELSECLRNPDDRTLSVLTIEIADFGKFSEEYGQDIVERVLSSAADKINANIRAMDLAALMDNGEFAILLPTADESGAIETSRRIYNAFAGDLFEIPAKGEVPINVFIGTATFPNDGDTKESLITRATTHKLEAKVRADRGADEQAGEYLN